MGWTKIDEGFPRNLKVKRAGPEAALLFVGLIALHHTLGQAGKIPANKATGEALELEVGAFGFDAERIDELLERLVEVQLLARAESGDLVLLGHEDYQAPCTTCRKPNDNPRRKTCSACLGKRKKDPRNSADSAESALAPEPEPARAIAPQNQNQPAASAGSWIAEGLQVLERCGVAMAKSLRVQLLDSFQHAGGGLWDLQRLSAHFGGKPGALVAALKTPGKWRTILLDYADEPGPAVSAVAELVDATAAKVGAT